MYFLKTLCKHLAVQAKGHLTAGLWWQWWVLVPNQTEKRRDLFQRKGKHRSYKVYVSRVTILPVVPKWVTLSRCHWQSTRLWAGRMRIPVLCQSQLTCLRVIHSLREPGAGEVPWQAGLGWQEAE